MMNITMFAAVSVCSRKIENGISGCFGARLLADERRASSTAEAAKTPIVRPERPAPVVALGDPEHEDAETRGDEHGAEDVEARLALVAALGEQDRGSDQRDDPDRDVDEEDPGPREQVDEDRRRGGRRQRRRRRRPRPRRRARCCARGPRGTSSSGSRARPARSWRRRGPGARGRRSARPRSTRGRRAASRPRR